MAYINFEVEDYLDEVDEQTLAAELISREKWQDALMKALAKKGVRKLPDFADDDCSLVDDVRAMVEAYKLGKPIDGYIPKVAWDLGVFV